jgi:hypothetical protein
MAMTSSLKISAVMAVALCLPATQAQACGELMLRSLDTMRYHAFVTHHAATIVLYVGDVPGGQVPADAMALHDALERTGHKVTVVRGSDELGKVLAARHYDVVISDSDDLAKVSTRWDGGGTPKEPALIPVLSRGADERLARERFPLLVSGGMRDLLKAIDQAMKAAEL